MKRLPYIFLVTLIGNTFLFSQTSKIEYGNNPNVGKYATVNGINMYYEIYGEGEPLLLLHGNGGSIRGHSGRIEYFKDKYQVIAVDSRAHGRTEDIGDSLTYKNMTKDINDLLEYLSIDSSYIWGQSDGGILGLRLAFDYPDKVKKLAVFGANLVPESTALFAELITLLDNVMKSTTDDHEKRLIKLMQFQPQISYDELSRIKAPVLIMSGDRDGIRLEHSLDIFYHIQNSNLFIMPGATHFGSYEKPELFNIVLDDFFTKPFSKKSTVEILNNLYK